MRISWALQVAAVFCLVAVHPAVADSSSSAEEHNQIQAPTFDRNPHRIDDPAPLVYKRAADSLHIEIVKGHITNNYARTGGLQIRRRGDSLDEHERPRGRPGPSRSETTDVPPHSLKEPHLEHEPKRRRPSHLTAPIENHHPKPTHKPHKPSKPDHGKPGKPSKPDHGKPGKPSKPDHGKPHKPGKPDHKPKPKPDHKPKPKPHKPKPKPSKTKTKGPHKPTHKPSNTHKPKPKPTTTTTTTTATAGPTVAPVVPPVVPPQPTVVPTTIDTPVVPTPPAVIPPTDSTGLSPAQNLPSGNNDSPNGAQPTSGLSTSRGGGSMSGSSSSSIGTIVGAVVGSVALAGLVALGVYRRRERQRAVEEATGPNPEMDEAPRTAFRHESFMALVKDAAQGFYAPGTAGPAGSSGPHGPSGLSGVAVVGTGAGTGANLSRQTSARSQNSQHSLHSRRSGQFSAHGMTPSSPPPPLAHIGGR